ncbi:cytochrome C oxidase subunit IV family protein [Paracrocinitomix mangrovi]|uniref:cytochrome C oxidase subunit IV family protein n=1 Tax=Paracrocinitomix mangrovi TaxID=2862509 RepID=UPI001C8E19A4|nr:cytochrome C oxidase subunit IV family protein [Paracrocinitomix mangrovi]UKN03426.1 cytochrome C oxidase subunit IV family protein [Paracrocinitomix mangrovi]
MERDDIVEYSLHAHHSDEEGKAIRKKIWFVTILLSVVTIVEVAVGIFFPKADVSTGAWTAIKFGYIILTLVKAGYIIMVFMHLGDENRNLRRMILWPYMLFICYLIFILLTEAGYVHQVWETLH